jgi:hypothetical protein
LADGEDTVEAEAVDTVEEDGVIGSEVGVEEVEGVEVEAITMAEEDEAAVLEAPIGVKASWVAYSWEWVCHLGDLTNQ